MSELVLKDAAPADVPAVVAMMNSAYRGAAPGWSTESGLLGGQRTDAVTLEGEMVSGTRLLLLREGEELVGSVQLREAAPKYWYLGGLTVAPGRQGSGLGDRVLQAAEHLVRVAGGMVVEITVIAQRAELIAWYERRSYVRTGETRPFPYGDERFGVPLRDDLHFAVLDKRL